MRFLDGPVIRQEFLFISYGLGYFHQTEDKEIVLRATGKFEEQPHSSPPTIYIADQPYLA